MLLHVLEHLDKQPFQSHTVSSTVKRTLSVFRREIAQKTLPKTAEITSCGSENGMPLHR